MLGMTDLSLSLRSRLVGPAAPAVPYDPSSLFAAGEMGVWYDPSDLAMMSQQAGFTQAPAVGSPVGMIRDKSQGTAFGANINTATVPFDVSNDGVTNTPSPTLCQVQAGKSYRVVVTISDVRGSGTVGMSFNVAGHWSNMVSAGFTSQVTSTTRYVHALVDGALTFTADGADVDNTISAVTVEPMPGYQAFQGTAASRPILRQDAGNRYYLEFDGVDDGLMAAKIDFSASDKISVFAGVHKATATINQCVAELSATRASTPGAFTMFAPGGSAGSYQFLSRGSADTGAALASGFAEPITSVISGIGDIAGDTCTLRVNGAQVAQGTADQGTGNCANQPLYVGRRAGASLPLNGWLYSLIVRGTAITAKQITDTETWVNGKTGAY